jgi:hypothetical protein
MKLHKMGGHMFSNGGDVVKTAETWDAGSVFPYLRDGSQGSSLMGAILAHEGVSLDKPVGPSDETGKWGGDRSGDGDPGHSDNENTGNSGNGGGSQPTGNGIGNVSIVVTRGTQIDNAGIRTQNITLKNKTDAPIGVPASGSNASTSPLRIVLAGNLTAGVTAAAGAQPDPVTGSLRQGAFWQIASANGNPVIPAGASIAMTLSFNNPSAAPLQYDLAIQDDVGYSEAAAVTRAFESLDANSQQDIVNFLRAQLIDGKIGEGSGR